MTIKIKSLIIQLRSHHPAELLMVAFSLSETNLKLFFEIIRELGYVFI
ncbi:hypothetical protein [Calothrix sp. NIES-3974]|nr:hypothetical protein [Calothrix sp. NIES-3974]BAZ05238.1 hypothetical protein NIES3974_18840 [Calothrix sp. NIES-3974]